MRQGNNRHEPVMPDELLEGLRVRRSGCYVDATLGRGGHSSLVLSKLDDAGRLIMFDRDPQAVADAHQRFGADRRVTVRRARLSGLRAELERLGVARVSGIMMDLGVSSPQLEQSGRGFSFLRDGPLDMRMEPDCGPSAADWLNSAPEARIRKVLRDYGEERRAARIARAIVRERARQPLLRTGQLARLVERATGVRAAGAARHPATRTFQAIRIQINDELRELQSGLDQALELLEPGGRLAVIAFHSLEDRIVKRRFARVAKKPAGNRRLPQAHTPPPAFRLVGKWLPSVEEVRRNPRSRSAVLRIIEYAGAAGGRA